MQSWLKIIIITIILTSNNCRWIDTESFPIDLFYDRIVDIKLGEHHASGVLFSKERVLTAFNPYRVLCRSLADREKISIDVLLSRQVKNGTIIKYTLNNVKLEKARQIIPLTEDNIDFDDWHGVDNLHSPLHDLMVMLITPQIVFTPEQNITKLEDLFTGVANEIINKQAGPINSELAANGSYLGREIRIAGFGFLDEESISQNANLTSHRYEEDDNVVADCDEWIPRDWGYFICILNIEGYPAISAGAILFYDEIVYGIGSFTVYKGNRSVLVFTDVRPYNHLLNESFT